METVTFTLDDAQSIAADVSAGRVDKIDLSHISQRRHGHADLTPLAVLGWWMLGADSAGTAMVVLPPDAASVRLLSRTGILFSAMRRKMRLERNGRPSNVARLLRRSDRLGQVPLPNVDWCAFDDATRGERLRAIPELEGPRFQPPEPIPNEGNRRFGWIDDLGAASALPDELTRRRFNGDADQALFEAVSNVNLWSQASLAVAVAAVTRGGKRSGSSNRFHVVVLDNGLGISAGLRRKRRLALPVATEDWRPEVAQAVEMNPIAGLNAADLETALLYLLVQEAFGDRPVTSTRDGHGLHALGVVARQWHTRSHVFSAASDGPEGSVVHVSGGRETRAHDRLSMPGARGTLVHLVLPALGIPDKDADEAEDLQQVLTTSGY